MKHFAGLIILVISSCCYNNAATTTTAFGFAIPSSLRVSSSSTSAASAASRTPRSRSRTSSALLMTTKTKINTNMTCTNRRQILLVIVGGIFLPTSTFSCPRPVYGRVPGTTDICSSIEQIREGATALRDLVSEEVWSQYTIIDSEGRAGSTDGARRILGGIAPKSGTAAIDAANKTPLYRIDVAFVTVRKTVLKSLSLTTSTTATSSSWEDTFDLDRFEELADRIMYNVSKCDGNFYSVLFAMKGGKMIDDIFQETKQLVKQSIHDFDEMLLLLKDASNSNTVCT